MASRTPILDRIQGRRTAAVLPVSEDRKAPLPSRDPDWKPAWLANCRAKELQR